MAAKITVIMGRAGTGKTHYMMKRIAENERKGIRSTLIVPDRATYETERRLSGFLGGGILYTYVLSFTSLAARVLKEKGSIKTFLTRQGRQMLVRRAVEESKDKLTAFAGVSRHNGFTEECDEIIVNCKRLLIEPEELKSAGEALQGNLGAKLRDFALIYSKINALMLDRYIDSEDLLNSLTENLPDSFLKGAEVFIDAPETLNESTLRIIDAMLNTVNALTVSLRGDTDKNCRDSRLFDTDRELYVKLEQICRAKNQSIEFISLEKRKMMKPHALIHLERNLFAYPYEKYALDAPEIEVSAETDRVNETRSAAEAILNAVKSGMRYRNIAVVSTDHEGYENIIKRVFRSYNIPFFSEGGRSVATHPVAELLLAALRCVEKGVSGNDFIRIFKTGLMDISRDDAERLENHILKYGLNGKQLTEPFSQKEIPKGIEAARQKTATPLSKLKEELGGKLTAGKRIEALYNFIIDIRLPEKLKAYCGELNAIGRFDLARETAQVYDTIVTLFDQLYVILGDEKLGIKKFAAIIEEGLNAYSVSIIPTTLDQVIVGDTEDTELNDEIKFLLILGMNEGLIPKLQTDNAIINDYDLAKMNGMGLPVWRNSDKINKQTELKIYSLMTKAKEKLRFSYCADIFGESAAPSPLISKILRIFPKCRTANGIETPPTGGTPNAAFPQLIGKIREMIDKNTNDKAAETLYAAFYNMPEYKEILERLDEAYYSDILKTPLNRTEIKKLYGKSITGTATRLEAFNQCPYRFFLQYGMGLKERERFEERVIDRGRFIHEALEKFIDSLLADNVDFSLLTCGETINRLDLILPEMMREHNNGVFLSSARMRAEFKHITEQLYLTCLAVICQLAEGGFRPIGNEIGFGRQGDVFPPLIIKTENGESFKVCGVVDRLDGLKDSERAFMRIIDYKTGRQTFDFAELANGLKLQLPLYAAAMEAAFKTEKKLKTAGFYYLYLNDWDIDMVSETEETLRKTLLSTFRLNGLTLKDETVIAATGKVSRGSVSAVTNVKYDKNGEISGRVANYTQMNDTVAFAEKRAAETLSSIMDGVISVSPAEYQNKSYCKYCPFKSVCRFDPTNGDRPRSIGRLSGNAFFKNISRHI